MPTGKAK